jgi:Putative metal-binding motif/FG-GAP repeat
MPTSRLLLAVATAGGCTAPGPRDDNTPGPTDARVAGAAVDADGDGYDETTDCDDTDPLINPGAAEVCNRADDDCDGDTDESDALDVLTWYLDADMDGSGDPTTEFVACDAAAGYAHNGNDCDDSDPAVGRAATETWYDGVDQDCDGASDYDADRDGDDSDAWGGGDCDDSDDGVSSDAQELCDDGIDQDCDGVEWTCTDLGLADAIIRGESYGDYSGWSVSNGGDVNGDGYDDLLIGSPNYGSSNVGAAWLVYGPPTTRKLGTGADILIGVGRWDEAGYAVAIVPDLDRDGYDDMLVTAPQASTTLGGDGVVYVQAGPITGRNLLSAATAIFEAGTGAESFGTAVTSPGDVDGDGCSSERPGTTAWPPTPAQRRSFAATSARASGRSRSCWVKPKATRRAARSLRRATPTATVTPISSSAHQREASVLAKAPPTWSPPLPMASCRWRTPT